MGDIIYYGIGAVLLIALIVFFIKSRNK